MNHKKLIVIRIKNEQTVETNINKKNKAFLKIDPNKWNFLLQYWKQAKNIFVYCLLESMFLNPNSLKFKNKL